MSTIAGAIGDEVVGPNAIQPLRPQTERLNGFLDA